MERQFLLRRTDRTRAGDDRTTGCPAGAGTQLAYVGLWSRVHGFTQSELATLLEALQVVRSGLLRSAQPFAAADDLRRLRPLLQPVLDRTAGSTHFTRNSTALDTASLAAEGLALPAEGALPAQGAHWSGREAPRRRQTARRASPTHHREQGLRAPSCAGHGSEDTDTRQHQTRDDRRRGRRLGRPMCPLGATGGRAVAGPARSRWSCRWTCSACPSGGSSGR
ncbi:DNA glycosylase AlkZ-like family protein [Streptomyces sp. A475]|uniref:DNA glycosylase AlkZ-like family protein n=1 Tax=Streptomyces sp. A475 TaxID=3131976 RepID=UPI004040A091